LCYTPAKAVENLEERRTIMTMTKEISKPKKAAMSRLERAVRDPDEGLELQEWVKKRLQKPDGKLTPLENIMRQCGKSS
jgi:hypothetical protein